MRKKPITLPMTIPAITPFEGLLLPALKFELSVVGSDAGVGVTPTVNIGVSMTSAALDDWIISQHWTKSGKGPFGSNACVVLRAPEGGRKHVVSVLGNTFSGSKNTLVTVGGAVVVASDTGVADAAVV